MYTTLFAHFVLLTLVFWLSLHVISLGGSGLCTCGAITLELITISFKKYVFKRVIQNWVENIPFSWVLSLFSCVCILSSLNAPWAYHLWIRRNINHTYYYYLTHTGQSPTQIVWCNLQQEAGELTGLDMGQDLSGHIRTVVSQPAGHIAWWTHTIAKLQIRYTYRVAKKKQRNSPFFRTLLWSAVILFHLAG